MKFTWKPIAALRILATALSLVMLIMEALHTSWWWMSMPSHASGPSNSASWPPRDLQKLYRNLQENGRVHTTFKSGTGLSNTTVRSLHLMLHCAFERAVKERLIQRNATDDCIAPKVRKVKINIFSLKSIKAYLEAAILNGTLPMFYLELVSGLCVKENWLRSSGAMWTQLIIRSSSVSNMFATPSENAFSLNRKQKIPFGWCPSRRKPLICLSQNRTQQAH